MISRHPVYFAPVCFFFLFTSGYTDSRVLRKITWKDHSSFSAWRGTSRWTYTNSDIEMRRGGKFIVPLPLCLACSLSLFLSVFLSRSLSRGVWHSDASRVHAVEQTKSFVRLYLVRNPGRNRFDLPTARCAGVIAKCRSEAISFRSY